MYPEGKSELKIGIYRLWIGIRVIQTKILLLMEVYAGFMYFLLG
jgi:hypothetical protein